MFKTRTKRRIKINITEIGESSGIFTACLYSRDASIWHLVHHGQYSCVIPSVAYIHFAKSGKAAGDTLLSCYTEDRNFYSMTQNTGFPHTAENECSRYARLSSNET